MSTMARATTTPTTPTATTIAKPKTTDNSTATTTATATATLTATAPTTSMTSTVPSDLSSKLAGDVAIALTVTLGVSPFLTIIDKAIVQRASGTHTMGQSCLESAKSLLRQPGTYLRSPAFLMMWGVYAATYTTANCLKTYVEHREMEDCKKVEERVALFGRGLAGDAASDDATTGASSSSSSSSSNNNNSGKMVVFVGTSVANTAFSLIKDRAYATMFGAATASTHSVPLASYGLWMCRDFLVVGSSFVLPERVSSTLSERTGLDKSSAQKVAQLACPVAAQFVAGPIQLLGLDMYNRPLANLSFGEAVMERALGLWRGSASVIGARIARIAPGYGIGGIGNTYLRTEWREWLLRKEMEEEEKKKMAKIPMRDTSRDENTTVGGKSFLWNLIKPREATMMESMASFTDDQ